jgi:hypothetical protein
MREPRYSADPRKAEIQAAVGSTPQFRWLTEKEVEECWAEVQSLGDPGEGHLPVAERSCFAVIADLRGTSHSGVQATLKTTFTDPLVDVVWDFSGLGMRVTLAAFADSLAALWLPFRDDIYLLRLDRGEVFLLHHERFLLRTGSVLR